VVGVGKLCLISLAGIMIKIIDPYKFFHNQINRLL